MQNITQTEKIFKLTERKQICFFIKKKKKEFLKNIVKKNFFEKMQ